MFVLITSLGDVVNLLKTTINKLSKLQKISHREDKDTDSIRELVYEERTRVGARINPFQNEIGLKSTRNKSLAVA